MTLRVLVHGAAGRMGRMVTHAVLGTEGMTLGAAVESAQSPHVGADAGLLCGAGRFDVMVTADVEEGVRQSDVAIDFSAPSATRRLARAAAAHGLPLVVGTTGLDPAALEALAAAAAQVPVVRSANMSLGVNVLLGLVERAVRALPGYDIEIAELHHRMKQDAPSGTALALAQAACRERELSPQAALRSGRSGQVGARTADEVGVLALRGGDVVGEHTVYLLAAGERLELTHRATSREIFVHGALRAARWVRGRPPGLYDMQDVLGLR